LFNNASINQIEFEFHSNVTFYDKFLTELISDKNEYQVNILRESGINKYVSSIELMKLKAQEARKRVENCKLEEDELKEKLQMELIVCSQLSDSVELSSMLQQKVSTNNKLIQIIKKISDLRNECYILESQLSKSEQFLLKVNSVLASKMIRIAYHENDLMLICKASNILESNEISGQLFMASPNSQIFLFLSPSELSSLFTKTNNYHEFLNSLQSAISNLFLYEFSTVRVLISAFGKALENDRLQAIRSGGDHGNEFKILFNDLKNFLNGKTIQPSEDMSEIIIKQQDKNGQEINLSPADLSHGELRRLSFYAWLKTNKIKNSIILVDEIEIGLHPDWQYQIVRDLEEWEPSNQYILATHSYEICSALSPAHVKEIEPKLLKSEAKTAQ
jgi:AAA domain, putative AbiEii toxin, Type IV TA system